MAPIYILIGFGFGYLFGKLLEPRNLYPRNWGYKLLLCIGVPALIYGFFFIIVGISCNWWMYMIGRLTAAIFMGCISLLISMLIFVKVKKPDSHKEQQEEVSLSSESSHDAESISQGNRTKSPKEGVVSKISHLFSGIKSTEHRIINKTENTEKSPNTMSRKTKVIICVGVFALVAVSALIIYGQIKIKEDAAYAPEYVKGYYHKLLYAFDWPDNLLAKSLVQEAERADEMGLVELATLSIKKQKR